MKEFNWDEFKNEENKIAVHCKTEEEAEDFCRKMHEHGMKWYDGENLLENTVWHMHGEKTCYAYGVSFAPYEWTMKREYRILEWSDYMQKEFTKADLRDGMVVEQGNEERFLIVGDRVLCLDGFNQLSQYADDLTNRSFGEAYGIEKVFKVKNNRATNLEEIFKDENLELIWERKEPKKMTVEEMREKLEELTGEQIEVTA